MATLTLENKNQATFTWQTNMSGNQILDGILTSPEGAELVSLRWEIAEDDRPLSEIEQEMLEELETHLKEVWVATANDPEKGDFEAIGFMTVGELLAMPADNIVWLSPESHDGQYQFTAATGAVKKYDGSEEVPLIEWANRSGVARS